MTLMKLQPSKTDLNMALSTFNSYIPSLGLILYVLCIQTSHAAASFMKAGAEQQRNSPSAQCCSGGRQ